MPARSVPSGGALPRHWRRLREKTTAELLDAKALQARAGRHPRSRRGDHAPAADRADRGAPKVLRPAVRRRRVHRGEDLREERKYHRDPGRASVGTPRQGSSVFAPLYPSRCLGDRSKEEADGQPIIITRDGEVRPALRRALPARRTGVSNRPCGPFKTLKEAKARRDLVAGEIARGRNPPTLLEAMAQASPRPTSASTPGATVPRQPDRRGREHEEELRRRRSGRSARRSGTRPDHDHGRPRSPSGSLTLAEDSEAGNVAAVPHRLPATARPRRARAERCP